MQKNILEYLENTTARFPKKTAFEDNNTALTFGEFSDRAKRVGTHLVRCGLFRQPVVIYMKRSPDFLAAAFGIVYSGCFYIPLDAEIPCRRIELILQNAEASYMICDETTRQEAEKLHYTGMLTLYTDCLKMEADAMWLNAIRRRQLDTDPVCIYYTSGSTGVPKGVVVCHRGIQDYTEQLSEVLGLDGDCVFGSQAPLYWDASMKEIYATLKHGSTTYLIPKELFMFPVQLVEYLNQHKINVVCWVVSALKMLSAFGTFDIIQPRYLRTVAFYGEEFPIKQFNKWKSTLPDVDFYNLYGPTEATGVSTWYHVERLFDSSETIPIGKPFDNTEILLLDYDGNKVQGGGMGEIYIRGSGVALGYYHDKERTEEVFVRNPITPFYSDRIYQTGDLAYQDSDGNLIFVARRDHQIKHMGHRIELEEIEAVANGLEGYRNAAVSM